MIRRGTVFIVGAGPASPDLLTLRGLRLLRSADLVIADRLVPPGYLGELGLGDDGPEVIVLGRGRGETARARDLAAAAALEGKVVVRLKGGDPSVFARTGEDLEAFATLGVPCEVVPGISSALAGPAAMKLPLTRRGAARSFAVATAVEETGRSATSWPRADNLVVLMGASSLASVTEGLVGAGWDPGTSAMLIERAEGVRGRAAAGTLAGIAAAAAAEGIAAPALLVVGPAAAGWLGAGGRLRVLFTGIDPTGFRNLGVILHWPALRLVLDDEGTNRLPGALRDLVAARGALVLADVVAVRAFFAELGGLGADARALANLHVIAGGRAADAALAEFGIRPDGVAAEPGGEARGRRGYAGGRVLVVGGTHVPGRLAAAFGVGEAGAGALVLRRAIPDPELRGPLPGHDVVVFTSPAGVRAWHGVFGAAGFGRPAWCLGPRVLEEVERLGGGGVVMAGPGVADAAPGLSESAQREGKAP